MADKHTNADPKPKPDQIPERDSRLAAPLYDLLVRLDSYDYHSRTHGGAGLLALLARLGSQLEGVPPPPPLPE